jgi:hypothetical protein
MVKPRRRAFVTRAMSCAGSQFAVTPFLAENDRDRAGVFELKNVIYAVFDSDGIMWNSFAQSLTISRPSFSRASSTFGLFAYA